MKLTVGKNRTGVSMAIILLMLTTCSWTVAQAGGPSSADAGVKPSFDCVKATRPAEKMVCASPELARLDAELQKAYAGALAHVEPQYKAKLVEEQRRWVRYVRDACFDVGCMRAVYDARISLLSKNVDIPAGRSVCSIQEGTTCRSVVYDRDSTLRMHSFSQSLSENHQRGTIVGCSRLIELPVGFAHSNVSFGGYCTLQDGLGHQYVMICNDEMIGHFAMRDVTDVNKTDKQLVNFTNSHCFGG